MNTTQNFIGSGADDASGTEELKAFLSSADGELTKLLYSNMFNIFWSFSFWWVLLLKNKSETPELQNWQ